MIRTITASFVVVFLGFGIWGCGTKIQKRETPKEPVVEDFEPAISPDAERSMAESFLQIQPLLKEAIPQAIQRAKIAQPICILRLYFWDNHAPKGELGLWTVTEPKRLRILAKNGKDTPSALWLSGEDPSDGRVYVPAEGHPDPDGEKLHAYFQDIHRLVCKDPKKYMPIYRKSLQDVARAMNQLDWSKFTRVTDDFVVVPADGSQYFGGGDDYTDIVASVPMERIKLLEQGGFIGPASNWERLP